MPGGVMGGVFGSGSIAVAYIQSLERLKGCANSGNPAVGHARQPVRYAADRRADRDPAFTHTLLSDTAQLFDALDARSNSNNHAIGARP